MSDKYYTGKGDAGDTTFVGSKERCPKSGPRGEALGAVDELNSVLGICRAMARGSKDKELSEIIFAAQEALFIIQAEIAGADKCLTEIHLKKMEEVIEKIGGELPEIKNFTIPGGTLLGAQLDLARTVVRRAERRVVFFANECETNIKADGKPAPLTLAYLNRLSTLMFVLARREAVKCEVKEEKPSYG